MHTLKETYPIARIPHRCCLCSCTIKKGQRYLCQTNVDGDRVFDAKCHTECNGLAMDLGMYDECYEDGLSDADFKDFVDEYIYEGHSDNSIDDVANEWQDLNLYDKVKKILDELKTEKK